MKYLFRSKLCAGFLLVSQTLFAQDDLSQLQHLVGQTKGEQLGEGQIAVSKDGQLMVAGMPSHKDANKRLIGGLRFYKKTISGDWITIGDIESPYPQSKLGASVAIDPADKGGRYTVVAGAYGTQSEKYVSGAGAVFVYEVDINQSINDWTKNVSILYSSAPDRDDWFGYSVDIYNDTIVVGTPNDDSSEQSHLDNPVYDPPNDNAKDEHAYKDSGAAYVFEKMGGIWTATTYLKASDNTVVPTKYAKYTYDGQFGTSVAINSRQIFVGAPEVDHYSADGERDKSRYFGAVYVFDKNIESWSFNRKITRKLDGYEASYVTRFAQGLATSEDYTVISVSSPYSTSYGKYAYVINNNNFSYYNPLTGYRNEDGDHFGSAIAVDGDRIIVGASKEKSLTIGISKSSDSRVSQEKHQGNNDGSNVGAAYLFTLKDGEWIQQYFFKGKTAKNSQKFGFSVAMSGRDILVGAPNGINSRGEIYGFNYETTIPIDMDKGEFFKDSFEIIQ